MSTPGAGSRRPRCAQRSRRAARRGALTALLLALVGLTAACSSSGVYEATPLPTTPSATSTTGAAATPSTCTNPTASYAPSGRLPSAGDMPAGSYMDTIAKRGRLIVGVSADTLQLGARNPLTNTIEGFDIDMAKLVSEAIFGSPDKLELRVISTAQRPDVLKDGTVDLVARAYSITCERWKQVAFSAEYYRAGQKVMVPSDSDAQTLADLKGKKVCAPAGSTSLDNVRKVAGVIPVSAGTHTGCLVLFQRALVDAISGDDTVLAGLAAQDPYAKVTDAKAFTAEPYGLGMSLDHPELVRFVNAVLERAKDDGAWKKSYNTWLAGALGPAPTPPTPVYGRTP